MIRTNPTLHTAALAGLEAAVNRALDLDPLGKAKLRTLTGDVFRFQCTGPELDIYLLPQADGLRLASHWDGAVTTVIRGEALEFTKLASATDPAAALVNGALELEGDSAPLIELQTVISGLEPDWEAPLVDALGDVAGHQLAEGLRGLFGWGRQASASLARQLEEFIHEEAKLAPSGPEVEDFRSDLEQLKQQVDRLQTRLRHFVASRTEGA